MPWLLNIGGKVQGPFDAARIRQMADAGDLKPSDLMWRSGMKNWVTASEVKGLFRTTEGSEPLPSAALPEAPAQDHGSAVGTVRAAVQEEVIWPRTRRAARFAARSAIWLTFAYTALELLRVDQRMIELLKAEAGTLERALGLLLSNTVGIFYLVRDPIAMALWIWVAIQPIAYLVSRGWMRERSSGKVAPTTVAPIVDSVIRIAGLACWPFYLDKFWYSGIVYVSYGYAGLQEDPAGFIKGVVSLVAGFVVLVLPGPRVIVRIVRSVCSFAVSGGSTAARALRDWIRGEWSRR